MCAIQRFTSLLLGRLIRFLGVTRCPRTAPHGSWRDTCSLLLTRNYTRRVAELTRTLFLGVDDSVVSLGARLDSMSIGVEGEVLQFARPPRRELRYRQPGVKTPTSGCPHVGVTVFQD